MVNYQLVYKTKQKMQRIHSQPFTRTPQIFSTDLGDLQKWVFWQQNWRNSPIFWSFTSL